ncbi:DUF2332 domain-containing protein [Sphingomonas sp.]|uniref:DUF2332 domain-containing protein n=1 Tax=Sphingomonas sp. TaxID=28214 RepID=UPI001EBF75B2|nr:DUF2332 domain-containing protein [Sphingomonas sp.]MBX3595032.1 DUF2332 domain-containing protein [Sphingomonas sp.]
MIALDRLAQVFRANAAIYGAKGSPLYHALALRVADDPEILALAGSGQAGAQPALQMLTAVHYLLMTHRDDPLAGFFATLTPVPAPTEQAYPAFRRFCLRHAPAIKRILATRTVQTTYVERCGGLLPGLSHVANLAGEPLDLIEIGCSAGILLSFDCYRYRLPNGRIIGPNDAPLTLACDVSGDGPVPDRLPVIGRRIGLDLQPVDARDPDARDWILALSFPEFREAQARLAIALDNVAQLDLDRVAGDALETLPDAIASTAGPLCVFHSACLYYWNAEARARLDDLLARMSEGRTLYRLGIELPDAYRIWANEGRGDEGGIDADPACDVVLVRYRDGVRNGRHIGYVRSNTGSYRWS